MASESYSAANNNWVVTQSSVNANTDHILFNGTQSHMTVTLSHSEPAVADIVLDLEPGGAFAHKVGTAGDITATGVPKHTAVKATVVFEFPEHNEGVTPADAELTYSPF